MKKLKRMMAVLLAMVMALAMSVTVFAAEGQGSLKVKVNENNTLEGQTLNVYKLFNLSVNGTHYAYTVNETYKAGIIDALNLTEQDPEPDSAGLYDAISKLKGTALQDFAEDFTAYALTNSLTATKTSEKITSAVKEYTFTDLDYGYYLVYQTGTKELQSSLVSVDEAEGTEVDLKGEAPSITKDAQNTEGTSIDSVEIGQIVKYVITGTIPDTTGYDSYVYKIKDTLTTGLDFVKDADGTVVDDVNAYPVSVKIGEGQATPQTAKLSGDNNRTMTLDLSQWIKGNQTSKGSEFTVTYYAKVNSDAVVTTNNNASLEYGNDPDNTITTTPVQEKTPTFPLQIKKFATGVDYLDGATFRIYRSETDAQQDQNAIAVTGRNGSYTVNPVQTGGNLSYDMVSSNAEVGTGFNLKLNGLAAGNYWIVETQAPEGYNGVTAPIKVTVTVSGDNDVNNWTISKNDKAETDKVIDIENRTGSILPGTGGMGTILFTVIGVALVIAVAGSFVVSRRRRAE